MKALNLTVLVLIIIGCIVIAVAALPYVRPASIDVEITTDKDIYHSEEHMDIVISLDASKDIDEVDINITGIENNRGEYKLYKSKKENLTRGLNNITFDFTTPTCSKCAGLDPGVYYINATVTHGEKIVNATHSINIEK